MDNVKDVAYDQGFSWIVMVASFLCETMIGGLLYSTGNFYVMVDDKLAPHSHAELSLVFSLLVGVFGVFNAVGGLLCSRFGCRIVAIIGGVMCSIGLILSSFATTYIHLCFSFGILSGSGSGLVSVTVIIMMRLYFKKYLSIAYGFISSGCGMGTLFFPHLLQYLEGLYGWRSVFLLCGAFSLNFVVCGALFRRQGVETKNNVMSQGIGKRLHLYIFKNRSYCILCINTMLTWAGTTIAYLQCPPYAISIGLSYHQSATLTSIIGVSNFFGRLTFGFLNTFQSFTPIVLLIVGYLGAGILTILVPLYKTFIWLGCACAGLGFSLGTLGAIFPQVVLSLFDSRLLGVAYGYTFLFSVIGSLSGGPLSGVLLDTTKYFPSTFYLAGGALLLGAAILVIPWLSLKREKSLP